MMTPLRPGAELTRRAVEGWASAVEAERYDLRLVHTEDKARVETRRPGLEGLLRLLPLLRARNAEGWHVYARPADTSYVLVDDVDEDGLHSMRLAGHRPAAVVVTSPWNYQVWIRLAPSGAGPSHEVAAEVASQLASMHGGDPGAVNSRQLGRLPGFRNRKALHQRSDGSYPTVTLRSSCTEVDPDAQYLLRTAAGVIALRRRYRPQILRVPAPTVPALQARDPVEEYREGIARITAHLPPGMRLDRSRADFAIARRLFARGASSAYVHTVLLQCDKAGELGWPEGLHYVERTVAAAKDAHAAQEADHGGGKPGEREDEEQG
ncbi:DNA-primase RepB domain-containing protein [Falsiroseomonas sp. E2-1-a20]|uniref:DNA-primase RepB domain-containing protein n=1 Tax=Falsiroseomonas sp. E2-1-a20 TaxID=3239300 RepID=UPI003F3973FA